MASSRTHSVTNSWLQDLRNSETSNQSTDPNYWYSNPASLTTTSKAVSFKIGTGNQIVSSILPTCAEAQHELIIVTCFWAKSSSREAISSLLLSLSDKAIRRGQKIHVRLCFSSISIFQKIFQTSNLNGKIYSPTSWTSLGLPAWGELGGLEMVVKSVFVRPFSVMHPKFIIVDRKTAFMPSCNVSWESWFEGCIEMEGDAVGKLFEFFSMFWFPGDIRLPQPPLETGPKISAVDTSSTALLNSITFSPDVPPLPTILLPSPHHVNPRFIPFQSPPPPTPLNLFLLQLFSQAKRSIFIQTPNLTASPAIEALFYALERGVDIHLITSSRLMILEQLVTAGTTTEIEIWRLRRRYTRLIAKYQSTLNNDSDPENLMEKPGSLSIGYYRAKKGMHGKDEPVKSHLKLVIMDEEVVVLGSGNQDRASWYTSQELGVTFLNASFAKDIRKTVDEALEGRVYYLC